MQPSTQGAGRQQRERGRKTEGSGKRVPVPIPKLAIPVNPSSHQRLKHHQQQKPSGRQSQRTVLHPLNKQSKSKFKMKQSQAKRSVIPHRKEIIVSGPPSTFKTLQEKMYIAVSNNK